MLLIGDLHLNSKIQNRLLEKLCSFVADHPEEKNLIFLGDFVYHFSYDRKALGAFFDQCLEWYKEGKQLYLLAGNHDWLGQYFVFDEGKKAFELFQGGIKFITKPQLEIIDGENILFLPHMLDIDLQEYPGIENIQDAGYLQMIKTENKNLTFSAKLNLLVQYFVDQYPENLTIIHHYYFDGVVFPGQKSKFSFKDIALDNKWLKIQDIRFISGHLHQAFCYGNYLCTGNVWASSPLEENQLKAFWKLGKNTLDCYETGINTYVSADFSQLGGVMTLEKIQTFHRGLEEKFSLNCQSFCDIPTSFHFLSDFDLKNTTLFLKVSELNYVQMEQFVSLELQSLLSDLKLKKQHLPVEDLLTQLQLPDKSSLQESFTGWTELLKTLLKKKYPEEYEEYEGILHDLHLL